MESQNWFDFIGTRSIEVATRRVVVGAKFPRRCRRCCCCCHLTDGMLPRARPRKGSLLSETSRLYAPLSNRDRHDLMGLSCHMLDLFFGYRIFRPLQYYTDASNVVHFRSRVFSRPSTASGSPRCLDVPSHLAMTLTRGRKC